MSTSRPTINLNTNVRRNSSSNLRNELNLPQPNAVQTGDLEPRVSTGAPVTRRSSLQERQAALLAEAARYMNLAELDGLLPRQLGQPELPVGSLPSARQSAHISNLVTPDDARIPIPVSRLGPGQGQADAEIPSLLPGVGELTPIHQARVLASAQQALLWQPAPVQAAMQRRIDDRAAQFDSQTQMAFMRFKIERMLEPTIRTHAEPRLNALVVQILQFPDDQRNELLRELLLAAARSQTSSGAVQNALEPVLQGDGIGLRDLRSLTYLRPTQLKEAICLHLSSTCLRGEPNRTLALLTAFITLSQALPSGNINQDLGRGRGFRTFVVDAALDAIEVHDFDDRSSDALREGLRIAVGRLPEGERPERLALIEHLW
jgi:hypothetical protein